MMERLTIDEIIEHCERKTKIYEKSVGVEYLKTTSLTDCIKEYWEHKQVSEYLKELKQYRDLNEQGLMEANKWILCSKKMPPVETEVFIIAKRKYKVGEVRYITTTAMYEDGTVLENDSCWIWEDIEGEWDEENDCYIIPEGWWENRHYNPDDVYNNAVDDEVIAWQPMPPEYQPVEE